MFLPRKVYNKTILKEDTMAFDGIFAKALVSELSRVLTDARITKIQQPESV